MGSIRKTYILWIILPVAWFRVENRRRIRHFCRIMRLNVLFKKVEKDYIVYILRERKGEIVMENHSMIEMLEQENARLKEDNEMLLGIMAQMKVTLNRLIDRYMTGPEAE